MYMKYIKSILYLYVDATILYFYSVVIENKNKYGLKCLPFYFENKKIDC